MAKMKVKVPCETSWGLHGGGKWTSIVGDEVGKVWKEGKVGKGLFLVGGHDFVAYRPHDKKQK